MFQWTAKAISSFPVNLLRNKDQLKTFAQWCIWHTWKTQDLQCSVVNVSVASCCVMLKSRQTHTDPFLSQNQAQPAVVRKSWCDSCLVVVCRRWATARVWVRSLPCCSCTWTRRTPSGPCRSCWRIRNTPCTVRCHTELGWVSTRSLWQISGFLIWTFEVWSVIFSAFSPF